MYVCMRVRGCSKLRLLADRKILHSKSMNQDINMLTSTFDIRVFLLAYPPMVKLVPGGGPFRINIKRKGDECHLALPTTTLILSKAVHVIDIHFMRIHKQSATNKFKACLFDHSHNLARNDRPKHLW